MIGLKLDALLKEKGMKPGTLATITGINKSTIYSSIKRYNQNVDYSTMEKIADALNVPVEYFHEQDDDASIKKDQETSEEEILADEFVTLFNQLPGDKKQAVLAVIKTFLAAQESPSSAQE